MTAPLDNETLRAIELARSLPVRMPSAEHREEMRTTILAAATLAPPVRGARSRAVYATTGVLAAAAVLVLVLVTRSRDTATVAHHAHGTVMGHPGSRFSVRATSPDEIVAFEDGVIDVEVTPLHRGERFRVITADSEVEVHGTAFELTAEHGRLVGVIVRHGVVEVRPSGGSPVTLEAGHAWSAPTKTAVAPPAPPDPVEVAPIAPRIEAAPPPVVAPARPRAAPAAIAAAPAPAITPARPPQAIAYDSAWSALRSGSFEKAAATFARVAILDPDGPLAEDASYWYPVALARAKRSEALSAFREFLDRYPSSAHAREASAMLGWLLVDANERVEAERRFRFSIDDSSAAVRDSARAGLAALHR